MQRGSGRVSTWVDVKLNSFYMLMFESRTTAHRIGGSRVAGLLTLVGGVGGRSDIGLLDGKTSTERSGDGVVATANCANVASGC
jgi:hypothetical protein